MLKAKGFLSWAPLGGKYQFWQSAGWLAYGVPGLLTRIGVPGWDALKASYAFSMLLGSFGMFLLSRRLSKSDHTLWALVPSMGYLYSPYILTAAFVRGAGSELLALGLIPWIGLGISSGKGFVTFLAAAMSLWALPGVGLVGTILAFAAFTAWKLFLSRPWKRKDSLALLWLFLGALVGGAGLLPRYLAHGAGSGMDPSKHVVYLHQLFMPRWGFGFSVPGWKDTMPLQLGAPLILIAIGGVLFARGAERKKVSFLLMGAGVVSILSLNLLWPLWHFFGARSPIAYPWQLLGFAVIALALAGGWFGGIADDHNVGEAIAVAALALILVVGYTHLDPKLVRISSPERPVGVFGQKNVALVEASVWTEPKREKVFFVRLAWQNIHPLDEDYSVFIHIVDSSGKMIAQHDELLRDESGHGTSRWWPGELVEKEYELKLKQYGKRPYKAHIGLYLWKTGKRLPVGNGNEVTVEVVDER